MPRNRNPTDPLDATMLTGVCARCGTTNPIEPGLIYLVLTR
jgi:hypothetical protein